MALIDEVEAAQQALVGEEIGLSDWLRIDQAMIDAFADVTMDDQFIHTDPARAARETAMGGTVAHGFLTLSLGSRFVIDCLGALPGQVMSLNYGFDKVRFLAPVPSGARVRARFVLKLVSRRGPDQLLRCFTMTIELEGSDKPALVADWLALFLLSETGA